IRHRGPGDEMTDARVLSLPVSEISPLLLSRKITSTELTELSLAPLEEDGPRYNALATLTRELALGQAREADAEISAGRYRGPLPLVPSGHKDLLDPPGLKT